MHFNRFISNSRKSIFVEEATAHYQLPRNGLLSNCASRKALLQIDFNQVFIGQTDQTAHCPIGSMQAKVTVSSVFIWVQYELKMRKSNWKVAYLYSTSTCSGALRVGQYLPHKLHVTNYHFIDLIFVTKAQVWVSWHFSACPREHIVTMMPSIVLRHSRR